MSPDLVVSKFLLLLILVIAIALHEFGHAAMTTKLGDPTARLQKRLTINPVAHFDPLGFAFLLMMVVAGFGFAWGRPVQTNPLYYDKYKQGIMLTAVAGPAINLCLAMFGIAVGYILYMSGTVPGPFARYFLSTWISVNVVLLVFNMLPIPPLDGGHLLQQLAPRSWEPAVQFLRTAGLLVLLGLMFFGVLGVLFSFVFDGLIWLISAGFGQDFAFFLFG